MDLVNYEGRRYERNIGLKIMTAVNVLFAGICLFAWRVVGAFLADPMSAATWSPLNRFTRPELLNYPYILLWGLPAAGIGIAWIANTFGLKSLARFAIVLPLLLIALVAAWYEIHIRGPV